MKTLLDKRALPLPVTLMFLIVAFAESGQVLAQLSSDQRSIPTARFGHNLAYDSAREKMVLFGGRDKQGRLADTWEWDKQGWIHRKIKGPPARQDAHMAYDAERKHVVLFGGLGEAGRLGDTWIYDGQKWSSRSVSGPSARNLGAMVYDPDRHVSVLFGGSIARGTSTAETWEWDGAKWALMASVGPSPRGSHAMAYSGLSKRIVMTGGWSDRANRDLWAWDGNRWTQEAPPPPIDTIHATMSFDQTRERLVLFGGFIGSGRSNAIWEFDGKSWQGRGRSNSPRAEHEATWVPGMGTVVFGGVIGQEMAFADRELSNDMSVWDGHSWQN